MKTKAHCIALLMLTLASFAAHAEAETARDEDGGTLSLETFALKNGGILILRHAVETEEDGSQNLYTQAWLQSAAGRSLIVDHEDAITFFSSAEKYLFRYEGIDFDDYFCLTVYDGEYYYYLFDKRSGRRVLDKFLGTADTGRNILFYLDERDETILYDLAAGRKYNIEQYVGIGRYGEMKWWRELTITDITEEGYEILFCGAHDRDGEQIPQRIFVPKR